jgi:hypothetical protein
MAVYKKSSLKNAIDNIEKISFRGSRKYGGKAAPKVQ